MKRRAFLASLAALGGEQLAGAAQGHPAQPGSPPTAPRMATVGRGRSPGAGDVTREPGHFGGVPDGRKEVVAWGKAQEWTVLLAAK